MECVFDSLPRLYEKFGLTRSYEDIVNGRDKVLERTIELINKN